MTRGRWASKPRDLDLGEDLPVDVLPCSNGEFDPPPPTEQQRAIVRVADAETDRMRRRTSTTR